MADELYIKYATNDTGSRPIPAGQPIYLSPSIWLTGGLDTTTAKVGVVNTVNVQVDSTQVDPGKGRANVKVQVWVCDFTLGGVGPAASLLSGSSNGTAGITDTVDTVVYASAPGVAKVPWTPVPADLINTNDPKTGHVCIGANVYVEDAAPEGTIKNFGLLDVPNNPHHAWKNIAVVAAPQGGNANMQFRVVNERAEPQEYEIGVQEIAPERSFAPSEWEAMAGKYYIDTRVGPDITINGGTQRSTLPPEVEIGLGRVGVGRFGLLGHRGGFGEKVLKTMLAQDAEPFERQLRRAGGELFLSRAILQLDEPVRLRPALDFGRLPTLVGGGKVGNRFRTRFDALDRAPFTLHLEGGDALGQVRAFDITQTTESGALSGGARIVTITVPENAAQLL